MSTWRRCFSARLLTCLVVFPEIVVQHAIFAETSNVLNAVKLLALIRAAGVERDHVLLDLEVKLGRQVQQLAQQVGPRHLKHSRDVVNLDPGGNKWKAGERES